MNTFGQYIKRVRESKSLTLTEVAEKVGMSHSHLSRIENGERKAPKTTTLKKLAEALRIPFQEIMVEAGLVTKEDWLKMDLPDIDDNDSEVIGYDKVFAGVKDGELKESPNSYSNEKELAKEEIIPIEELIEKNLSYKGHNLTDEQKKQLAAILEGAAQIMFPKE